MPGPDMSEQLQALRGFVRRRLTAAVDDIFVQLERTISECEAELQRRSGRPPVGADVKLKEEQQKEEPTEPEEAPISELPSVSARSEEEQEEEEEEEGGQGGGGGGSFDYVVSDGSQDSESESTPGVSLQPRSVEEIRELLKVERAAQRGWKKARDPQLSFISLNGSVFFKLVIAREEEPRAKMEIRCPMCPKTLSSSRSLKAHMRCHTGEEPYSCSFCGKRFKWNADCASHMRVHTGERPYVCDVCGKRYLKSGHLRQHVRSHAIQKPFSCQDCGRRFASSRPRHKCPGGGAQCEVQLESD